MQVRVSDAWCSAYPGAAVGILALSGVTNSHGHDALDRRKAVLVEQLRSEYGSLDRSEIKALPVIQAYGAYYRQFRKTYHVLLQLESVVHKGKDVPSVTVLVCAMFMAELKNHLLTAGHDVACVEPPICLGIGNGETRYTNLAGQENAVREGDMVILDARGVLSSIVHGSDRRTCITPSTRQVLYTTYAPPGIGGQVVARHMDDIVDHVRLVSPTAELETQEVVVA